MDYDPTGNIVFSGQGETGNTARVYVDNKFLGDAPVGEDGRWTFSGTADVAQGVHTLRVDGLDAKGKVVNRVEVPFFREEQTKVADATQPASPRCGAACCSRSAGSSRPSSLQPPPPSPPAAETTPAALSSRDRRGARAAGCRKHQPQPSSHRRARLRRLRPQPETMQQSEETTAAPRQ